ncbi:RNA-directed DNA polymerase protein [Dioscorea alata]|uniref:RNA-directed DNA polymerase protein n=1 Tax=Dioscorea alata TaxID=55571 RepID=A0ACB7V0V2_DIOAL|nr:RNA-directed DNA polymerase protein [Dioscorea alata]
MNFISWNVRGLGGPSKKHLVRDFLDQFKPNFICIQESKLDVVDRPTWRAIAGNSLNCFCFSPACGTAGGMIIGWNGTLFKGNLVHSGNFCLSVEFTSVRDHSHWFCTTVYGPNARNLKEDFWTEIRSCKPPQGMPWIICGDFNAVFSTLDKNSGNVCWEDIHNGQELIRDLNLVESSLHLDQQPTDSCLGASGSFSLYPRLAQSLP